MAVRRLWLRSANSVGSLNDLWRYSPSTGLWSWIGGASTDNAVGTYGTQGTAAAGNSPGARQAASSWTDSSGNLWLFGGYGYASSSDAGYLNDPQYSPNAGVWNWISGASTDDVAGTYGTQGTAAAGNSPGARQAASSWIHSSGNMWLFRRLWLRRDRRGSGLYCHRSLR